MVIIALLLFSILALAQYETILYDPITSLNPTQWSHDLPGVIEPSPYCPSFAQCFSYINKGELWGYRATTDYHSIRIHYTLRSFNASSPVCELWYVIGRQNNVDFSGWTKVDAISANHQPTHRILSIPGAEDNLVLGISFYNEATEGICYLNNVTITGIPITQSPTRLPTTHPTAITPTTHPTAITDARCCFSDDYLKILITFGDVSIVKWDSNLVDHNAMNTPCDEIFINSSTLLGDSNCIVADGITMELASNAVIDIGDELVMTSQLFAYMDNASLRWNSAFILDVLPPKSPFHPTIIANVPSMIGICDDLVLNAVNSMYLGGRGAIFEWELAPSITRYGPIVSVDANDIAMDVNMVIRLYVTTWYNVTATKTFTVHKSGDVMPHIALSGPNTYTVTNENYNRDYIHINALISYSDDCITQETEGASFPYSLHWAVSRTNALLETYLDQQNELQDADHIAVDVSLLSPGNQYIFKASLLCNDDAICDGYNTSAALTIMYEFSAIVCSMYSTDQIHLNSLTATQLLNDYMLYLDGYTMTYDPDTAQTNDKAHLKWQWQCVDNHNHSCNYLLDSSSSSTLSSKYITFDNDTLLAYHFMMTVYDETNENRSRCTSALDVYIDLLDDDQGNAIQYLSVFVRSSSANAIRSSDRLRLMVMILNDEITEDETGTYYQYEWTEIRNQMSTTDLAELNLNSGSNGNLILKEGTLEKGKTYEFEVHVSKVSDGVVIGYGMAPSIEVRIMDGPRILDIMVTPSCHDLVYSSLSDLLNAVYHISVIADGEYAPLSYAFVYLYHAEPDSPYSMHRSVLSEPYLMNTLLPFGTFTLQSVVYDAKSSVVEDEIECDIRISDAYNDPNECVSFKHDVMDQFQYSSKHELLLYLLQSTEIYLHYIEEYYYFDNIDCLQVVLPEIIEVYHEYLIQDNNDESDYNFCVVDWTLFMGKIFTKYMKLWTEIMSHSAHREMHTDLQDIELVISSLILDGCSALTDIVKDIDLLFVSPQSMIDGNAVIYYETRDNDITPLISKAIVSDHSHSYVLYELSASVIQFVSLFAKNESGVIELLSKSLYIHTLFALSSSIPGESSLNDQYDEFEIYSTRMDPDGSVNVSVHQIQVSIPSDLFDNGRDSFCDITQHVINSNDKTKCAYNSVDVIIISQNNSNTRDVPVAEPDTTECSGSVSHTTNHHNNTNGTLFNSVISIILIGGNSSASQISITFHYDASHSNDTDLECVWYDEVQHLWKDTGCETVIHNASQTIECECNHLTTFSLVHNINLDACNQLLRDIAHSIAWRNTHIVFAILFSFILCHALRELLPFIIHKQYHPIEEKALLSISLVAAISFIHITLCLLFVSLGSGADWYQSSSPFKALLTFLLLCPQWIYFVIFSIVLYSWIIVSYRSTKSATSEEWDTKSAKALLIAAVCLIGFGLCDFIFISFVPFASSSHTHWYYSLSRIVWIVFTFAATVLFTVFGYWTQLIVRRTAAKLETRDIASAEIQLANKLLLVTCVIISFFLLQCVLVIYFLLFSAFNHNHMLQWRICDLVSNLICLSFVCLLYKNTLNRLRAEEEIKPMCYDAKKCAKHVYKKYVKQYETRLKMIPAVSHSQNPSQQRPKHSPIDSNTCNSPRRSALQVSEATYGGHSRTRARSNTGTALSIPDDTISPTDRAFGSSSPLALPALNEMNEIQEKKKKKKKKSKTKRSYTNPVDRPRLLSDELIFGRKELLRLSKIQLAKKCRVHGLPSNGTKGDIVNRLLKYQRHQLTQEKEKEKNEVSITAAEAPP